MTSEQFNFVGGSEQLDPDDELLARLIYAVVVAGKNANFARGVVGRLLRYKRKPGESLRQFLIRRRDARGKERLNNLYKLGENLKAGNYRKFANFLYELLLDNKLDLRTCTPQDLEKLHGVGPKTSRFFILWTRPDAQVAALDVHVLRWLGAQGYAVPEQTPSSQKVYAALEEAFIKEAEKRGMTPQQLDAEIWGNANVGGIK
jgi:hypothetical protein